jgi:hypothetical protein
MPYQAKNPRLPFLLLSPKKQLGLLKKAFSYDSLQQSVQLRFLAAFTPLGQLQVRVSASKKRPEKRARRKRSAT